MNNWDTWDDGWFHGLQCPVCGNKMAPGVVADKCPDCVTEREDAE